MTLASLVSAGASPELISQPLEKLGVTFTLATEEAEISGVGALRAEVTYPDEHAHRTFGDIRRLITSADLPERVSQRSIEAFRVLAIAEGSVHGLPAEEVTFHEVGAVDSIVDMVGSCMALELLNAESVSCGPLPMGNGVIRAAHGLIPVPGPATLEVLKGCRVRWTDEPHEMTTPTGAALMRALTGGEFTDAASPMTITGIGYGAGDAVFQSAPNLLRAVVGEIEGPTGELELIEANLDDAAGEFLAAAVNKLIEFGAPDAWLEPITMKHGRGAYKICALVRSVDRGRLARLLMRETGALGVRHQRVERTVAERRTVEVELTYGECRVKIGSLYGEDFVVAPEYEDAARLARKSGHSLPKVYSDARLAYHKQESEA